MADPGDGKSLLGGGGGEQGTGAAEENLLQLAPAQLPQKVAAQGDGAAPAAGAACVDILYRVVKNQISAVGELPAEFQSVPLGKLHEKLLAQLPQIAGDDHIIILHRGAKILKMGADGCVGRRG